MSLPPQAWAAIGTAAAGLMQQMMGSRQARQELEYQHEKDKLDRKIAAQKNLQNMYTQGGLNQQGQLNNIVGQLSQIMGRVNQ